MRYRKVGAGEVLVRKGEAASCLFVLISGAADICGPSMRTVHAGHVVGQEQTHMATVEVSEPAEVMELCKADLPRLRRAVERGVGPGGGADRRLATGVRPRRGGAGGDGRRDGRLLLLPREGAGERVHICAARAGKIVARSSSAQLADEIAALTAAANRCVFAS